MSESQRLDNTGGSETSPLPPLVRVAVLTSERQVDVTLPATVPLRVIMDDLVDRRLREDIRRDFTLKPGYAWTLAKLGADPLDRNTTLAEAGVYDGELLVLRNIQGKERFLRVVEEVEAAVSIFTDLRFPEFTANTARAAGLAGIVAGAAGIGFVGYHAWRVATWPWWIPALLGFIGGGLWLFAVLDDRRARPIGLSAQRYAAAIGSWVTLAAAALTAVPAADYPRALAAANWMLAGVVVAVAAVGIGTLTRGAVAASTAATVVGAAIALSATIGVIAPSLRVSALAAWVVVASMMGLAAAPKLTLVLARLRPPDLPAPGDQVHDDTLTEAYRPEAAAEELSTGDALERHTRNANKYLTGLVVGFTACLSVAAILTANAAGGPHMLAGALTAAFVAALLFLRARSYVDRAQVLAMYLGAVVVLVGSSAVVVGGTSSALTQALMMLWLVAASTIAVLSALRGPGSRLSPPMKKWIERLDKTLIAAAPPVALWATGIYGTLKGL